MDIVCSKKKVGGKTMSSKLAAEFMDAKESKGGAFKKKKTQLKWQKQYRAFSHYRW